MNRLIVLDTNIIVSAGLKDKSACAQIVEKIFLREVILLTCPLIVEEYCSVLQRPKFLRYGFPPLWLKELIRISHFLNYNPPNWPINGPDPDDLVFLSLAKMMEGILITGNLKHFPISICNGVKVFSPQKYVTSF